MKVPVKPPAARRPCFSPPPWRWIKQAGGRASLVVLLAVLWGCGPTLHGTTLQGSAVVPPVPSMGSTLVAGPGCAVASADGQGLPCRMWTARGTPRALIIAVHGFNDYSNAFALPGPWFAQRGITTLAYDQRGFGRTPDAGRWPGAEVLVDDLVAVVAAVRTAHPGVPVTLLGESMGAAVIIAAMAGTNPPGVEGIVLSAPAVWGWSTLPLLPRGALWLAGQVMPWQVLAPPRGFRVQASDNIAVLRGLGRDPLVIKETRTDAVYGLTDLMEMAWHGAARVRAPTLLLYGRRDELIPPEPVATVSRSLAPVARQALYPAGWHMLLRDLQAELVWRDIAAWTLDHQAPLPSGEERLPGTGFGEDAASAIGP